MSAPAHYVPARTVLTSTVLAKAYKHVCSVEAGLIHGMMREGVPWRTIQRVTKRSSATLFRVVAAASRKAPSKPKGAPVKATKKVASNIIKATTALLHRARAQEEVTAAMIKTRAKANLCEQMVRKQLHHHKIRFYKLKERPLLKPEDVVARLDWAKRRTRRS